LAYSEHRLDLGWIIIVGTVAAALGDNLGYAIGHHGGRPLLERYRHILRIPQSTLERGEKLFARWGASTIFFARFIFGLRIFAGPLAGVLRMPWRAFALFNFLGAVVWVTAIATAGYLFGKHWDELEHVLVRFNLVVGVAVLILIPVLWRKYHRDSQK
jgi:membrane-associated protein